MTDSVLARDQVDLTNCDREPIHIPGAILPHGAMLVLDGASLRVLQAAGDTEGLLGRPVSALLSRPLDHLFSSEQINRIRALSQEPDLVKPRHLLDPVLRIAGGAPLDASAHRVDGDLVLEFEAAATDDAFVADPLAAVQLMVEGFSAAPSLFSLCQMATASVRRVAQYDRVMIYRFMPDGSGWVIAESRAPELAPFLDLHISGRRHSPTGQGALPQELAAADHPARLRSGAADAGAESAHRQAAGHEPCGPARRFADPPRIPAQHGHQCLDVDFHHRGGKAVGVDRLP